ncbi:Hypothetical protein NTJ_05505 [Nesidiocoris tenuis]|uniref:Uncharacterized protein n=1 Tax=Nesidiocoris tenuis TaxID=355587 RepID=A0ABN7AKB7_9HEMI|nr:Hypothetical protein NTJ_05505 [Nesidiocoris tenuis]
MTKQVKISGQLDVTLAQSRGKKSANPKRRHPGQSQRIVFCYIGSRKGLVSHANRERITGPADVDDGKRREDGRGERARQRRSDNKGRGQNDAD